MIYKIKIIPKAKDEINEAYFYYESVKAGLGERFIKHLESYFIRITKTPEQFPLKRMPYREAFIKKFPYLIIFEIRKTEIIVYSVFNTWQNPQKKVL
ncbi:type II toxin-antitoxin system RelE/ParE family toxin [Antarcticibacterium arcticum]|uniref:Type II toxin-antitoxin system RelE/ParE family toxin n=1 Tax=Antarcticibacterium arcticum TaxID=2585771 RepID=A0A5B8YL20_9FLAO|nr:type II toxin-antitoxin system RelE/ParE family toxin [Antarcticibacterium arcticum]QED38690.1 type II toxin-antitoxin system RelE/ParE family toxin [Antarcticibacterium arcticum]